MKIKHSTIILAAILAGLCLLCSCAVEVDETPVVPDILASAEYDDGLTDGEITVYIGGNGASDDNDGTSAASAVETVEKAFLILDSAKERTKTLVVSGELVLAETLPENKNLITITGDSLVYGKEGITLSGPVKLENINVHITTKNKFVNTEGHRFVIGEGVTKTSKDGIPDALNLHAGTYNIDGGFQNVEINSDIDTLFIGAYYNDETRVTDGALVTVNAGTIKNLSLGSDGWTATQKGTVYTDTVSIVYNGGNIEQITARDDARAPMFEGAIQLIANGGLALPELPELDTATNIYRICCEASEGCALSPTREEGIFEVIGSKSAVAKDENGKEYYSASGIIKLPSGNYTVSFTDDAIFKNDGRELTFFKNCTFDLADAYVSTRDGEFFIGWKHKDGRTIEDNSFKRGDILVADFVQFDPESDFPAPTPYAYVSKGNNVLSFIVDYSSIPSELSLTEAGYVYALTKDIGAKTLELDADIDSLSFISDKIDAEEPSMSIGFAGFDENNCKENHTARGYVKYIDLLGNEYVIYSPEVTTNFFNIALTELEKGDESFAQIVEKTREKTRQEYFSKEKIDVVGSADDIKTHIYRLGDDGIMLRDAIIIPNDYVDGETDREPVEIVQLSDLHFNYVNQRDFEEANPSIMATYAGRKWLANGKSVPNAVSSLDFASFADQIVVTGDILDYMSWGCIELTERYLFDPYPTAMATLGNHEATRRCQDTPKTPDPTTLESRMDILQENWIHDVYYYSKVIDNRVMLIQLDNGAASKFWDSQIEPLGKDLETARENGYTVLLFYHIPLCTNNPAESDLAPIRRNDTYNYNFMEKGIGNATTEGTSKIVYDLITDNADIIKGAFCGHMHSDYYTEIVSPTVKNEDGTPAVIPQYVLTGNPYDKGHALVITVK